MSSRSPIRQSARTPPPTLLLPSSLVKEQTSADASPPQTETAKPAKPPPGPLAPAPGDPTVSAPSGPPSMKRCLTDPGGPVNTCFRRFSEILKCSSVAPGNRHSNAAPGQRIPPGPTRRKDNASRSILYLNARGAQKPRVNPQLKALDQGRVRNSEPSPQARESSGGSFGKHDAAPEQWFGT